MIRINFECDTVAQLHSEMIALLAGTAIAAAGAAPAATATRGRGKKAEEVQPPTAPQADAGAKVEPGAGAADVEVTKETLNPRVLQLGAKAGPQVVMELFKEFGANKFSELPADKYGEIDARIEALLATPAA